jgi:hypothetical protein
VSHWKEIRKENFKFLHSNENKKPNILLDTTKAVVRKKNYNYECYIPQNPKKNAINSF